MSKGSILIVDDSQNVLDTFCTIFDDEYEVVTSTNAEDALKIIRHPNDIDVVLVDVILPDKKGTDLLNEIKRINPNLKVVIITGYDSKEIIVEALRFHADDYIEKPFDIHKVKDILERLIQSHGDNYPQGKIGKVLSLIDKNYAGDLSLNEVAQQVCLGAKYLSRMFKEKTGKTFNEYKLELKVNQAKRLLKKTGLTINQIAYQLGYHNPEAFMKIFKKLQHCTPSQYRFKYSKKDPKI